MIPNKPFRLAERLFLPTDVSLYYDGRLLCQFFGLRCLGISVSYSYPLYYPLGFHADLNQTYPVGNIDEDSKRLIQTTKDSLDAAINVCKPGALFRDIGKAMYVP